MVIIKQNGNINMLTFFINLSEFSVQFVFYSHCYTNKMKYNKAYYTVTDDRAKHRHL